MVWFISYSTCHRSINERILAKATVDESGRRERITSTRTSDELSIPKGRNHMSKPVGHDLFARSHHYQETA